MTRMITTSSPMMPTVSTSRYLEPAASPRSAGRHEVVIMEQEALQSRHAKRPFVSFRDAVALSRLARTVDVSCQVAFRA